MLGSAEQLIAGRYALDEVLGRGGAGVVWRGRDTVLDRVVAIKVFRADLAAADGIDSSLDRDRVLREARLAARLSHPGAVGIYDVVEHEDRLHLVMELVEAPDLATLVATDGPLDPVAAARIGLQLLDVLEAAHAIGVVHRDVKPSNVMVPADGRVRLADFGTAILAGEDRLTATDVVIGSPAYMAPEQATARDVGPEADLWSLGTTLYQAVEGEPPFSGPSAVATMHSVLHDDPRPMRRAGALSACVQRLMVTDPVARADAAEARSLLESVVHDQQPTAAASTGPTVGRTVAMPAQSPVPQSPIQSPIQSYEESAGGSGPVGGGGGRASSHAGADPGDRRGRQLGLVTGVVLLLGIAAALAVWWPDPTGEVADTGAGDAAATAASDVPQPAPAPTQEDPTAADLAAGDATADDLAPEDPATDDPAADAPEEADQPSSDQADAGGGPPDGVPADPPGQEGRDEDGRDRDGDDEGADDQDDDAAGAASVPADWTAFDPDHAPYRVSHPPSWTIERLDGTRTDISDPSSSAYLRLDWTDDPAPDPLADWESYESAFASRHSGYQRIRLEETTFDGQPAALWEYRYTSGGATLHAYNLNVSGEDYGYALNYQTSEAEWAEMEPLFATFRDSYDIVD